MSTKTIKREITRSRTGCWTCRTRRKKCDETRPACRTCINLDLTCEGYGVRLKWAVHRKSRVTFNNPPKGGAARGIVRSPKSGSKTPEGWSPEHLNSSPTSQDDAKTRDDLLLQHLGEPTFSSLSILEKEALYDFADWGAATLGATMNIGPEYFAENLAGCNESRSMLLNCLTYQITLDPKFAKYADEYYCRSLEEFRNELSIANSLDNDSTPCAGLLLCSISMNRGMPWTVHLNGITAVLREKGHFDSPNDGDKHDTMALIGALDLPTHILGRQHEHLHVWYKCCRGRPGIEEITGLPRTLIDILSSIMQPGVEDLLIHWKPDQAMEPSDAIIYKIWNTVRWAAVIAARDFKPMLEPSSLYADTLRRVLEQLRDLEPVMKDKNIAARRALLFPLVAVGSLPALLDPLRDMPFITRSIFELSDGEDDMYHLAVRCTLTEYWEWGVGDGMKSLQRFATDCGKELGLF